MVLQGGPCGRVGHRRTIFGGPLVPAFMLGPRVLCFCRNAFARRVRENDCSTSRQESRRCPPTRPKTGQVARIALRGVRTAVTDGTTEALGRVGTARAAAAMIVTAVAPATSAVMSGRGRRVVTMSAATGAAVMIGLHSAAMSAVMIGR